MLAGGERVNRVVPVAVKAMAFQTQSGHLRVRHGDTARIATAIELRSGDQATRSTVSGEWLAKTAIFQPALVF